MGIKEFRSTIINVFLMLLVMTGFFYFYHFFNPFDFPGLWQRLLFFNIVFGALSFFLYFEEISTLFRVFRMIEMDNPWGKIRSFFARIGKNKNKKPWKRKIKYRYDYQKSKVVKKGPKFSKVNLRKIGGFFSGIRDFFRELSGLSLKGKFKLVFFFSGIIGYSVFLYWIYPKFSFDEFMFFVLLLYVPISLIFKLDPRYPIGVALGLLVICAIVLAQGFEDYANRVAIYAYYGLVIGVGLMFVDYLKNPNED